jgi:MFS family permease
MRCGSASTLPPASVSAGSAGASSRQSIAVYATGVVQGIVLVTFPAASAIFTANSAYGLSSTQYGVMFLPQVAAAIVAALLAGRLIARFGTKRIYQAGLAAGLLAMVILFASQFVESQHALAYVMLLIATGLVGAGFGLTVPTLNTLTAEFHPKAVDRSTLILNALLGVGTALAPAFVALFVGLGFWWGLPILSVVVLVVLFVLTAPMALAAKTSAGGSAKGSAKPAPLPPAFWLFAAIALLYGIVETMSGNWAGSFVSGDVGGAALEASLALTAFWASVTLGRVLFAALQRVIPSKWTYRIIPILAAAAYVVLSLAAQGSAPLAIVEFALAGLGCSALLPLTISFSEDRFSSPSVSGRLIAVYQVGYGIAAFGVGPLVSGGLTLRMLFVGVAVIALAVSVLAVLATRGTARAQTQN